MVLAYRADRIFTGSGWIDGKVVVVDGDLISDIVPSESLDPSIEIRPCKGTILAPAFIDAQVYGAAEKLFSLYPSPSTLALMNSEFSRTGTCLFQPTVATNSIAVFHACIDAVREYWNQGGQGVSGLHLEGPWINPEKRGAHLQEFIRIPNLKAIKELLEYGKGVITMITLAPERCPNEVITELLAGDVILSAGHSNASYQESNNAFDLGISRVTHLFNAMSALQHREPGLVGACFNHLDVMSSIIPDGYHVAYPAVAIAYRQMANRLFAITDAVTETIEGPYQHRKEGNRYLCNGTLSGSALTMHQAFKNLVNEVGLELGDALRLCSANPAKALGVEGKWGSIAKGAKARFICLDNELNLVECIT